jgi:hypothetical protein
MLLYVLAIWSILPPFGVVCRHLVYFMNIWYIFSVLVSCTKKNLATLATNSFNFETVFKMAKKRDLFHALGCFSVPLRLLPSVSRLSSLENCHSDVLAEQGSI